MSEIRSFKDKVLLQATKTFDYTNRPPSFGCIVGDRVKSETASVLFSDHDSPPSYSDVAPCDASPSDESSVYQNLPEETFEEPRLTALNFGEIHPDLVIEDDEVGENNGEVPSGNRPVVPPLPVFSGVYTCDVVREVFDTEMEDDNSSDASTIFEESESFSVGEVMKSPVFSEDESSENSLWIDLGQYPLGSDSDGNHEHRDSTWIIQSSLPPVWFTSRNKDKKLSSPCCCE